MFRFRWFGDGNDKANPAPRVTPPALDLDALRKEEQARGQATQTALSKGQLPPHVANRIRSERAGTLPWTSDLSVQEWASLRTLHMRPLGQVMGSSVYHVGYVANGYNGFYPSSHEMLAPTKAMYEGRRLAISRMRQEAALLGANAVVGVELRPRSYGESLDEFLCFGTAVAVEGLPESDSPVLCTVSGQDFLRLVSVGTLPVGLALGATFYYLRTDWWSARQSLSWYNQEMQQFSRGVQDVRRLVQRRLREDVVSLGASGVVGADFSLRVEEVNGGRSQNDEEIVDHVLEAMMIGTAVEYTEALPKQFGAVSCVDLRA